MFRIRDLCTLGATVDRLPKGSQAPRQPWTLWEYAHEVYPAIELPQRDFVTFPGREYQLRPPCGPLYQALRLVKAGTDLPQILPVSPN